MVFCISENFYLKDAAKRRKICFLKEKNAEMLCMFQKSCTFAPSKQKDDNRSLILGYGVMVTQQILVLFFLVRVRVAQLHLLHSHGEDKALLGYGVMVTQQILVLFFLVRVRVAQQKRCSE